VHVPATIATLAFFTAVIVLLRLRWTRLPGGLKRLLILFGIASIAVVLFAQATRLYTTHDGLNAIVYWCSILSYIFFVVLFTLLRPRWLTWLIAVVLLLPLLSASPILPLGAVFSHLPHRTQPIGDNLVSDLVPIDAATPGASGADLVIYRRFTWAPFLQHRYISSRYFDTQCDTAAAYAILQPDHRNVLMVCPAAPGHPLEDGRAFVMNLHRR